MVGIDQQKKKKIFVAEMGGPIILFGFLSGAFIFLWADVFIYHHNNTAKILAVITTAIISALIGMLDDLTTLSKKRVGDKTPKRIGLKQWQKPLLTLPVAIPLMAIMAGTPTINIPVVGAINLGILYPLIIIPLGVVGATNAFNMLAGLNGLEAGMGSVLLSALGIYALLIGETTAGILSLIFVMSLIAFLHYNWYPSKIFPGDSLTYLTGAMVASVAIIGNFEKFAVFCFIPWIIEFFIKARHKFKKQSYGQIKKDGTLKSPGNKIYSLTHVPMKFGLKENQVVLTLIIFEVIICLAGFAIFYVGIW